MRKDHSGAADEAQAFATLLVVPMCLSVKENERFSAGVPQDCVEAVPSLPQEGGFDVAEQTADARMSQRSTAMPAVTKAMESDLEARQMSKRVCCGRCPSLRPVQFCWSFFGCSVAVQQRFLGHVQVWIYSERPPCKEIGAPRRNRRYLGYEQALG